MTRKVQMNTKRVPILVGDEQVMEPIIEDFCSRLRLWKDQLSRHWITLVSREDILMSFCHLYFSHSPAGPARLLEIMKKYILDVTEIAASTNSLSPN